MKCEQAFYTRDKVRGLEIAASSNPEKTFIDQCLNVGSNFETEPAERTAEFVLYSRAFGRYVGVGVSPSTYRDGTGVNKLVHIWVPEADSADPGEYYLPYEFDRKLDFDKKYEGKEVAADLGRQDFGRILQKYGFDKERLAGLLNKVIPVIFGEENQLYVVVSRDCRAIDAFPLLARELTWLFYNLIPVPDQEKDKYGRRLSYSVLSKVNTSVVNIVYTEEAEASRNVYLLDGEDTETAADIYYELAERALISKEAYDAFVSELYRCSLEETLSSSGLQMAFLCWQLEHTERELEENALPVSFKSLIARARREEKNRRFLYLIVRALRECAPQTLADLAVQIFRPMQETEGDSPIFFQAYKNALQIAYRKKYRYYIVYVRDMQGDFRNRMEKELWEQEDSCIAADIERICSAEEALAKLNLYEGLWENASFLSKMKTLILDSYYFQMEEKDRKEVSSILDAHMRNSSWNWCVRLKIIECFQKDTYAEFLSQEMGRIEKEYSPFYFQCFIKNCGKERDPERRKSVQKLGRSFLRTYESCLEEKDLETFAKVELGWVKEDLDCHLESLSLEELSAFHAFGEYFAVYSKEMEEVWYQKVLLRLKQEEISETVLQNLLARREELSVLGEEAVERYTEALWNACQDNLLLRICCSVSTGSSQYNIWNSIALCDIESYEKIRSAILENKQYCPAEKEPANGFLSEPAEFNRRCYLFWKRIFQKEPWSWEILADAEWKRHPREFFSFLDSLERWMTEQTDTRTCANYLRLQRKRGKYAENAKKRCASYEELKYVHRQFYYTLLGMDEVYTDKVVTGCLREIKLFERLDEREEVTKENLEDMARLLYDAEQYFEEDTKQLSLLKEEFKKVMEELKEEQKKIQDQINAYTNLRQEKENQIEKLRKEVKDLEKKIKDTTQRRNKMKTKRERAKALRRGEEQISSAEQKKIADTSQEKRAAAPGFVSAAEASGGIKPAEAEFPDRKKAAWMPEKQTPMSEKQTPMPEKQTPMPEKQNLIPKETNPIPERPKYQPSAGPVGIRHTESSYGNAEDY